MSYIYKIKYGYSVQDFVLVNTMGELEKAIYAMRERIPVKLGEKFINGRTILTIEPDIHSYTGWYRTYEPTTPDDEKQIQRDMPEGIKEYLDLAYRRVSYLVSAKQVSSIGREVIIKELDDKNTRDIKELPQAD